MHAAREAIDGIANSERLNERKNEIVRHQAELSIVAGESGRWR
jgi:hypothetical protein